VLLARTHAPAGARSLIARSHAVLR